MRKRIEPTLVEKAIQTVDGFEKAYKLLQQQVTLRGQSRSTLENYIRQNLKKGSLLEWYLPLLKVAWKKPVTLDGVEFLRTEG